MKNLGLFVFGGVMLFVLFFGLGGFGAGINKTNSEANLNNANSTAVIVDSSSNATAIIMKTSADSTKTVAESCQIQPYREDCLPPGIGVQTYPESSGGVPISDLPLYLCFGIIILLVLVGLVVSLFHWITD